MSRFFRERGLALAIVIVVSAIISLSQGGISYSVLLGALRNHFNVDAPLLATVHWLVRLGFLVLAGTLWTLRRKRAVFRVIIVTNAFFTAILLTDVAFLLAVLSGSNSSAATTMLADVALIAVSNILIFSMQGPGQLSAPASKRWQAYQEENRAAIVATDPLQEMEGSRRG